MRTSEQARDARLRHAATAVLALSAPPFSIALAQSADSGAVEQVVVTGTSIRGVAAVGSPTIDMNREDMAATGLTTAGDLARSLPQVLTLGADESRLGGAQDGAANTTRTSAINLRGIGNEATLLLVNGRRIAPSGVIKALYDPNQIPVAAIERMELVVDGASAVYGSDAVAGVVNLITRKDFSGAETMARHGGGDGIDQNIFSQTFGRTWDGGSLFFAYEHNERSALSGADRDYATQDRRARGGSDARSNLAAPGNIVIGTGRYPLPPGSGVGIPPASLVVGPANRFDETSFAEILPDQERDSVLFNAYQNINESLELYYEGFFTRHDFSERVAPASGSLRVPNTNPFFVVPAGVTPTPTAVTAEYRFLREDVDPRLYGQEDSQQHVVGMRFDLANDWQIDGYLAYNDDSGYQIRGAITNSQTLTCALAGVATDPTCAPAGVSFVGALNPFGDGSANSAELASLIIAHRDTYADHIGKDLGFKADGSVADISGGAVQLAVGAEYYDTSFEQELWATNITPNNTPSLKHVENDRQVSSAYAELFVPLVGTANAKRAVKRLELSVAARYDDYSTFGGTTNPKYGVVYAPTDSISLRASYGTSFRAPSLVDTNDKIHNIFIQNLADPTSATGTTRGIFHNGGRSTLEPEEATTWTTSFDWRPEFLSGFTTSVTYYEVDYTDRIDVVPNTALTAEAVYAPYIIRNPTVEQVNAFMTDPDLQSPVEPAANIRAIVDGRRANLGQFEQTGVDLGVSYSLDSSSGNWFFGLNAAIIQSLERSLAPGLPSIDVLDTFGNPVDDRARFQLGWRRNAWTVNAFVNYVGGYTNTAITPNVPVDSLETVDASLDYAFDNGLSVSLSGQNLLDEDPPIVLNGTVSWDSQNASAIGRFLAVGITKSW